jgi:hypothetical protein
MEMSQGNALIAILDKKIFFKSGEQEGKTCWGWYQWKGEDIRKGEGR